MFPSTCLSTYLYAYSQFLKSNDIEMLCQKYARK